MPYKDSYVWNVRQKIGHDPLIVPGVDVLAFDDDKVLMIFNKDFNCWLFPGGYAELGQTWQETAARELMEEGGLRARPEDMIPFACVSGHVAKYANQDVTYSFGQIFVTYKPHDIADAKLDTTEVSERKWFTMDELEHHDVVPYVERVMAAYRTYDETGTYQVIEVRDI